MTAISSVVLVDKRIHDHETIVSAVKADGVRCIVFDVFDVDKYCQEQASTTAASSTAFQYILNKIGELGIAGSFSNIGIVQHNTGAPFHRFFAHTQGEESRVMSVETADPTLQTWAGFAAFVTTLKNTYSIQNVDLMACALYSNPEWKYIIDTLVVQTGITVRASTDDTGAASLGGDWFLESHTGINLKDVYFTEAIEDFHGVLYVGSNYWQITGSYRRPIKSFAVGGVELWGVTTSGGSNNTSVSLTNTVGLISNDTAMAALKTDGSVVVWGRPEQGATYATLSGNVSVPSDSLTSGVVDVVGNAIAFAAIKSDGSVVIWGRNGYGGNNNTSVDLTNVIDVYNTSSYYTFAALKSDGSVVCWGDTTSGGSTTSPVNAASSLTSGVVLIYGNGASYAALKTTGSVVTWGNSSWGGNSSSVSSSLTSGVVAVYTMNSAYAALKNNGSLVIWGSTSYGGLSPGASVSSNVIHVFPTAYSAVALKTDGSIVHWGESSTSYYTGTAPSLTNVVTLCANVYAFAALKSDGTVVVWGGNTNYGSSASTPVNSATSLTSGAGVIALYSNYFAFAALKSDGTVVCWGNAANGGTVPVGLTGVVSIRASERAFAALKTDGSVIVWGDSSYGGSNNTSASISTGIVDIYNTQYSFAALKPTSTPSYDLSMSYYNELDQLTILCSRDYRRTANLTANSNKFTISLARSLQKFNYTMPTNQPLTLIVPDYQSGSYSLTSTITIPATAGGANSNSFLITSEVGERVDISGAGTYVNYGTYVYKVESNGTYTKTTSLTLNNTTYNLYGGDGFYYSGIAMYYRLGAFTVPAKTFGDASFILTPPTSDSSGAFTYTSSNTSVATVTSGGTVTIVGAGTTTITATQAANGVYPSDSITASLVVGKAVSTLGALTVPSKNPSDEPFTLTAPTSTISSIISAVNTITSTASVIPTPPDSLDISYADTWTRRGTDIDGEATGDYSGWSVSMSADGTVMAIGAYSNDGPSGTGLIDRGHVRVYTWNGTSWVQRGSDIDGEANASYDYSGQSVSISADGTVVAIGASYNDGTTGNANDNRGHVRVYAWNGTSWVQRGNDIDGEATDDRSGYSVSMSANGTVVAIGAYNNDATVSSSDRGHVRVYAWNGSSWIQRGADIDGEANGDNSGENISISADGTVVAIGARYNDGTSGNSSDSRGHVRVYAWNGTSWVQRGNDIDGEAANDKSGFSVSISADGTVVAIGAYGNDGTSGNVNDDRGHVRVYAWNGTSWVQRGADIDGETIDDYSGYSVSISADGTIVAIGAPYNDGTDSSVGHVRIYAWNGTSWIQRGQDMDGEAASDNSGWSVSMSADGRVVAIGAPYNDGTGSSAGHVRVYQIATTNAFTYSSSSSSIADVCGNLLLIKGVNGTSTITATQTGNTVTGRLDVSGTTYTLQYNPITYTSSNTGVASVSTYGTVTLTGTVGSSTITATQPETLSYSSRSVTGTLNVSFIAPTIGALSAPAKNFGDASFNLTAPTSNSDGAFTYTSSAVGVATVTSGGTVTIVGAGSTTITATQAASGNYTSGSVTASLVVSPIAPTIGALSAPAKNFGDASFDLTAPTSNSDGAFTYTSSAVGVATVTSGGTVTVVGAGSTTITATQAATTNYTSGSVTASLVVSAIAPTIGALSTPAKNFGDASFNLTAPTSNSGGAFSYTSSNVGVATVTSGGTVTIVGAGSTTITATQAATTNYTSGSVTASLVVSPIAPTYQSIAQITKTYSTDVSFSLLNVMTGISNSDGSYTFSSESTAIDICGGVATILAYTPSAITITASQDASGNYAASSKTFTLLVNRKTPSYGAFSIPAATYEDAPFSIAPYAPTTDSTSVPFTYTSSDPNVATISADGTVVTIIGQGYTTITASQDASGNYSASSTTTSFLVNRAAPTFLKAFTIPNKTFGDASFSLLPFTDGLDNTDGTYHFTSSNAQLVSISEADGVTATIHAYTPSPITIYVAIDACGNYAASSTSGTLTVLRATPTFGAFTVPAKNFGDASFSLTAPTSNSNGAFTYTSSNTAVASVTSGGIVTIVSAGSTTITATQEISGNYTTRDISASLVVSPIAPTIGTLSAPAKNLGDTAFNLTAPTSNSNGAFTYTSSDVGVATVTSGGTVTIVGVGSTTITATQAASTDGNYTGGSSVTASLVVSASLSNFNVPAKTYGDASFNLTDPDTTDNTVGFTFASSNTSVATLSGRTVTIVGAGSTVITATQAATASRGQLDISATLVVSKAQPVITIAPITKLYGNASFRPVPTTTNTDAIGGSVFTFTSNNISVVSMLDASLVRINGIGSATLSITQAASANFTDASSSVVVTVNKGVSGFSASTFTVAANKTYGDAAFAITTVPISSSTGTITYTSSDENVATITSNGSGNAITLVGQGTVTFTASQAESALYTADTKTSNTLTVVRKTAALTRDTPSADTISKVYGNAAFTVTATNESNGTFSFTSSDPSIATIDGSTGEVTIVAVGSTTLTATRSQTAQYNASSVSWTLNIARGTTTLVGISSQTRNVTATSFTVTATSASDGAVSYALQNPSSTVLTIHPTSGLITLLSPGSAVIVASQAQGTMYEAPANLTATITVTAAGNTLQGATLTNTQSFANVDLSGASLTNATITNTNFSSGRLNNSNFGGATISGANMSSSQLSGASFANSTVSNTNFISGQMNNANLNGVSMTGSNMTSAVLSDATMRGSTITGTDFTSANLQRTDLSGANVRSSIFNSADLSGSTLVRLDASGASFVNANLTGANLSNADFTNANMTNTDISGADITNVTFTIPQKLQLLKNTNNRTRSEIQISQTTGNNILAVVSAGSAVNDIANITNSTFKVISPTSTTFVSGMKIIDIILDTDNYTYFYFTIKDDEYFRIEGIIYHIDTTSTPLSVRNYATGAAVENTTYGIKAIRLLAGSLTIIVNSQNTLSTSSFVVPSMKQNTDAPFSPTTLPTSNSSAAIVYSSSNTNIATINSSTGVITPVAGASGYVIFTASQAATETHESASITSNELFVNQHIDFTLIGLNQTFSLSTLASLDASSIAVETTDATAVFYVRLSDMTNLFQYQTDSFDVNNVDASDIKYYVFHRTMPTELHINPSHAMMNKTESAGMLGSGVQELVADKSLVKHDFIRYLALRLFNTYHGVDLFQNEEELHENLTYLGETVQHNIDTILSGISTTSASESMTYDASGNKYLTNDASGNTNLCRELMRQLAAADPSRFYNNGADTATSGLRNVPLRENDSINFKLTITASAGQNNLTGVSVIPSRTYLIKMVLKNTVNASTNANTVVTDSEMYPNSYMYSTSVVTYAPTAESSSGVYNVYSPPAPIPTARFGYNGWYYANTTTWVNVAQSVRDRVKWVLPSNAAGSSTVADLRYIRMNLKIFNKTSLPFLVVTTQAGSSRKYTISAPNSLANGTVYSFYMNFNSYTREPATIGTTNAALTYSNVGSGSFANGEVITSIAVETDSAAAAGTVEFTLSSVVIGEASGEKEHGFSANV